MEPKLISNPVYEAMQPATLSREPVAKSTILYANRFSGVGEIKMIDEELISVMNSTVGGAGNNVLVQLKKKMSTFRNGPWYIDSRDGAVYIHNRKMSQESVYTYIYQSENGEVLYASFKTVEVFKPMAGIASALNALTKTIIHQQNQMMEFNSQPPQIESLLPTPGVDPRYPHVKKGDLERIKKTYRDRPASLMEQELARLEALNSYAEFSKQRRQRSEQMHKKYMSQSPEERVRNLNKLRDQAFEDSNHPAMFDYVIKTNPRALTSWNNYESSLRYYRDPNNPHVKAAYQEAIEEFRKVNVSTKDLPAHYSTFVRNIDTKTVTVPNYAAASGDGKFAQEALEKAKQKAAQEAINEFAKSHPELLISNPRLVHVEWRNIGQGYPTIGSSLASQQFKGVVRFCYEGYGTSNNQVTADRLLMDVSDRYAGSKYHRPQMGNAASQIRNAMSNLGRGAKEKRLQAEIRVVGNPILECMQQVNILNVGKKHSGVWYITSISHSLEHGQGYVCDIQLSKQLPKNGMKSNNSEVHTQAYTVDNDTANPQATSRSKGTSRGNGTTRTGTRPQANVVKGNHEYTYQDALNEDLTSAESAYVQARASTARSDAEASKIISSELHRIASHKMRQRAAGTNNPYAVISGTNEKGQPIVERKGSTLPVKVKPDRRYTSSNYDRCVQTYLRNKRRK